MHSGDFEWEAACRERHASPLRGTPLASRRRRLRTPLAGLPQRASALDAPRGNAPEGLELVWQRLADRRITVWQEDLLEWLVEDMVIAR